MINAAEAAKPASTNAAIGLFEERAASRAAVMARIRETDQKWYGENSSNTGSQTPHSSPTAAAHAGPTSRCPMKATSPTPSNIAKPVRRRWLTTVAPTSL